MTVLILGESGTGKELVRGGASVPANQGPFVAINVPPFRKPCWRANCLATN